MPIIPHAPITPVHTQFSNSMFPTLQSLIPINGPNINPIAKIELYNPSKLP